MSSEKVLVAADLSDEHTRQQLKRAKIWQRRIYHILNQHVFGVYWDMGQAIFAILGFCMYCAEMYLSQRMPLWMLGVEAVLTLLYICDFALYFIAAERKVGFLLSPHALVDILSILPVATLPTLYSAGLGVSVQFLRILRLFRAFRLLDINSTSGPSDATIMRQVRTSVIRACARWPTNSSATHTAL